MKKRSQDHPTSGLSIDSLKESRARLKEHATTGLLLAPGEPTAANESI